MAWVRAATAGNNNQISSISAFFVPYPPLLSGTDYYVEKEGLSVGDNTLYIENTSPRLALVTDLYSGLYELGFQQYPKYIDFRLFPNLAVFHGAGNNTLVEADLRENASLNNFYTWTGGLSGIRVIGLTTLNTLDIRNGTYQSVNLSGTKVGFINFDSSQLSAFEFANCNLFSLDVGRIPWQVLNLSNSSTRALSSITSLNFGPHNRFSNKFPRLSSFNFTGPLSSITNLRCNSNQLTTLELKNLPTLNYLHAGYLAGNDDVLDFNLGLTNGNLITDPVLQNLPALQYLYLNTNPLTALNVTGLTALELLDISGYRYFGTPTGSISSLNIIIGLSSLSALKTLNIDCNPVTELDFSNYPPSFTLQNLSARSCSLTALNLDNLADSLNALNLSVNTALSTLDITNLSALNLLDISSTSNLRTFVPPAIPNNLASLTFTNSRHISAFNYPTLNNVTSLSLASYALSSVQLNGLSALKYFSHRTSAPEINLTQGLSSINTLIFTGNPFLSSIATEGSYFANLTSILTDDFGIRSNKALSAFTLTGAPVLKNIYLYNSPFKNLNVKNNPLLNYFFCYAIQASNKTLDLSNCPTLNEAVYYGKINTADFTNCTSLTSASLNSTVLTSLPALPGTMQRLTVAGNSLSSVNISNLPSLNYLAIYSGELSNINISNAPSLNSLLLDSNQLSALNFTGSIYLSSLSLNNNGVLSSIDNVTVLHKCSAVRYLGVGGNSLSNINLSAFPKLIELLAYSNNLSSADLTYNPGIFNLQLYGNDLRTLDLTPVTGVRYLYLQYNSLTSIMFAGSAYDEMDISNNQLDSEYIDSALISVCASPSFYFGNYENNNTGRSSYSNAAYTNLINRGITLLPDEPNNTVSQPVPKIAIVQPALPATLQYTQTLDLSATATYLGNSVPTFYSVLSGPGVTLSPTVSALSGSGTITVLVSTLSTTVFAPTSALFDITLTKLDISSFIQFGNTGFVYDGTAKSVSAFSVTPPGLNFVTYYLSSGSIVTPVDVGTYTVSAIVTDANYAGSASTTMNIYPAGFYILPAGAKSSLIYSTSGFDTRKDIVMTFDYAFYGTTTQAGEGFCVSFVGYTNIVSGGAPGYGLNYTNASFLSTNSAGDAAFNNFNGLYSGILGIGFDNTGNFGTSSYGVTGLPNAVPNSIALRGGFYDNYQVINRTNSLSSYDKSFSIYQQVTGANTPVYRRVRVRLADLGKRIIVQHKELSASDFNTYMDYYIGNLTPTALRPCLSYSSGLTAATFKVKNFNINGYFNNNYNEPVEPGTFDTNIQIPVSGGPAGSSGVSFVSLYQNDIISYDRLLPTDLPESMDIYINNSFVANVLFDPIYTGRKFQYYRFSTLTNYEGVFAPGSVAVL